MEHVFRQAKAVLREVMDEKFQIVKEIGKGGFGIVHEAVNVKTGAHYAIKTMRLPRGLAAREKQQAEIDVLTRVGRCLNICTLFEVLETPGFVHLVMELCTGGTLAGRLTNESGELYSEARVAELMRDILRTVAQCHKCNVVHRDIKPENFLFHHPGEGAPLKAIDFGLAVYAPRGTVSPFLSPHSTFVGLTPPCGGAGPDGALRHCTIHSSRSCQEKLRAASRRLERRRDRLPPSLGHPSLCCQPGERFRGGGHLPDGVGE